MQFRVNILIEIITRGKRISLGESSSSKTFNYTGYMIRNRHIGENDSIRISVS